MIRYIIILHFDMERKNVFESANDKCDVFYMLVCKRKILLSILMACIICVYFSQLVDHCVT